LVREWAEIHCLGWKFI